MEIESFEPYHIGIKLSAGLDVVKFRKEILDQMTSGGWNVIANPTTIPNPKTTPIEILSENNNIQTSFNYVLGALNTDGLEPSSTTNSFEKLFSILSTLGYEIQGMSTSVDITTNVYVKTDKVPSDIINNSVKCDLAEFKKLNNNTKVNGLRIELIDEEYAKESMTLIISPNPSKPKTSFLINFRYTHIEAQPIIDVGRNIDSKILKLLQSLEAN